MINIVTSGCSFTHDPDSWANVLQKKLSDKYTVTNVAQGGCGQEFIVRSAIMKLQQLEKPKICIVQFSGFYRVELIVDALENPELYNKIKKEKEADNRGFDPARNWYELDPNTLLLLRTTDQGHNWYKGIGTTGKFLEKINSTIGVDQRLLWTIESITRLQMYCKINKIPLFCFLGWRECLGQGYNHQLINRAKQLIDWGNFWFYNNDGGMADWMLDHGHHGKLEEDHINKPPTGIGKDPLTKNTIMVGHPTAEAHNDFCEQVIVPWVNSVSHE